MFGGGWGRLAARGEGSGGGDGAGVSKFFCYRTFQVKPQERKELCGGREGQTTYYVERKALPRKATLL